MIRKVRKEDFEQVYEIEKACFKDPYPREQLEYEFSSNPVNVILVAEEDNKVLGFIDFMITFNSATIWNELANLPVYLFSGFMFALAYDKFGFSGSASAHITNNLFAVGLQIILKYIGQ